LFDLESRTVAPLAPSDAVDNSPAFSHDGRFVAFTSSRDGGRDLYRVEVSTGEVTRLTSGIEVWSQPSWSPDGTRIAFSGNAGVHEVYVVAADGTNLTRLTRGTEGTR
jgi:TolB protein